MATAVAVLCMAATAACAASGAKHSGVSPQAVSAGFLDDKVAAFYLSTQMDSLAKHGQVVFIKRDGTVEVVKHGGLDVGRLAHDGRKSVLVADRSTDTVIGAGAGSTSRGPAEDVGFFAAWVPQSPGYLSLFNSGQDESSPEGYSFALDWYDRAGHHTGSIPYYLETAGVCDGDLYAVSSTYFPSSVTGKPSVAQLLRTRLGATAATDIVATWPAGDTTLGTSVGQIVCQGETAYFMFQSTVQGDDPTTPWGIYLTAVVLKSGKVTHRMVHRFAGRDEAEASQTWFAYRSTHLDSGTMYYLNGQGGVYAVDLTTGRVRSEVVLDIPHYQNGTGLTYWSENHLYFLYQSPDPDTPAVLTCYDFTTGTKVSQLGVKGLKEVLMNDVHPTDLIVFS